MDWVAAIVSGLLLLGAVRWSNADLRRALKRSLDMNARLVAQIDADRAVMASTRDALGRIIENARIVTEPEKK